MLQTEQVKYKIFNDGANIAELTPKMSIDHKNIAVQTGWQLKRWLTKKDRLVYQAHNNVARHKEGRVCESKR